MPPTVPAAETAQHAAEQRLVLQAALLPSPDKEAVAAELRQAMHRAGAARYGSRGFSLPRLPDPLVIPLHAMDVALRHALGVVGIRISGEAGPGSRLILDRPALGRCSCQLALFGGADALIALGAGAAIAGQVRLEGAAQAFIAADTRHPNQHFPSIIISGREAAVAIGRDCSSNGARLVVRGDATSIVIGDDCMFAHDIEIAASDSHGIFDVAERRLINPPTSVQIGPHVWLGARTSILKGVRIGAGAIVGKCAVVTRPVPAATVAAGLPARVLRRGVTWSRHLTPQAHHMDEAIAWLPPARRDGAPKAEALPATPAPSKPPDSG